MTSTLTTFASPLAPEYETEDRCCLYCLASIYRASDGNWHHTLTGSRKCARSA